MIRAATTQRAGRGLLLRLVDEAGRLGQGEASPLPGRSREPLEACEAELQALRPRELPALDDAAPATAILARALAITGVKTPAARFALETALCDLLGQRRAQPVASLLGGAGALPRRLRLSALVTSAEEAAAAVAAGAVSIKLKVARRRRADELALLRELRARFPDTGLRLDANRGLELAEAKRLCEALAPLRPELFEEPVATAELARMAGAPVPLAADESLAEPGTWPALAEVCAAVVLKPTMLGLLPCLALAAAAAARGLGVVVTHAFEGPIALAACAELAVALPGARLAAGLWPHAGLRAWPRVEIAQLAGARAASARRPGLGLPEIKP